MEFQFSANELAWRKEVRSFLRTELPADWNRRLFEPERSEEDWSYMRAFQKKLAARGWVAIAWPKAYGGQGRSFVEQLIYAEEMAYHRAPTVGGLAVTTIGPSIILFGDEAQKKQHLGRITRADTWWCQGFSEPSSGSDLASLQTRAVEDGDDWVINGSKIWTTQAHHAEWCYLAARTDPEAPKHRGITVFLVDMKTHGIRIRPIPNMAGLHSFNQVFFEDVRIPRDSLLGERNRGWYQVATTLDFERSLVALSVAAQRLLDDLVAYCRVTRRNGRLLAEDSVLRNRLAEAAIQINVGRMLAYRVVSLQTAGRIPNKEASAGKVWQSETYQRICALGLQILGPYGALAAEDRHRAINGYVTRLSLTTVGMTIGAGASEIQRNVIAQRGLGLPR